MQNTPMSTGERLLKLAVASCLLAASSAFAQSTVLLAPDQPVAGLSQEDWSRA